ncbi:hypothetical protein P5673_019090 [Acropora cervicornis]|uniref:Uncharacterized protein n=1 Tax=Acropora cervicornis TaxID=6130 RepID=A0AAD9QBX6_ACRCE|nr:hypothetical protein P5673_019090 [Acropora cervicornis]
MKDLNKLDFEVSDVRDFRNICEHLERLAKECKKILWESMRDNVSSVVRENIESLNFTEELTKSREPDREDSTKCAPLFELNNFIAMATYWGTNAGILCDDRERFRRFSEATGMMTKSKGAKQEVEKLSEKLEDSLITLCSLMAKVLDQSRVPLPEDDDLRGLEDALDQKTKAFLECFKEDKLEDTDGNRIDESTVDEVRNYAVTDSLCETLLWFKIDFNRLTKEE